MAVIQEKVIPTTTTLTSVGSSISIYTYYDDTIDSLPNTIWVEILDVDSVIDGDPYSQGEVVLKLKNNPEQIYYYIDDFGEVCIVADDAGAYYIDPADDQLTYDFDYESPNVNLDVNFNL